MIFFVAVITFSTSVACDHHTARQCSFYSVAATAAGVAALAAGYEAYANGSIAAAIGYNVSAGGDTSLAFGLHAATVIDTTVTGGHSCGAREWPPQRVRHTPYAIDAIDATSFR